MIATKDYFVGKYTDEIIMCQPDEPTGAITIVGGAVNGVRNSSMYNDPIDKYLYAVREVSHFEGIFSGSIISFRLSSVLSLTYLNR